MRLIIARAKGLLAEQHGMVTVEAALGLAAILSVVVVLLGGMAALATQIAVTDTAGAAARAAAIGVAYQPPPRIQVRTTQEGGMLTVEAQSTVPLLGKVRHTARAPLEVLDE